MPVRWLVAAAVLLLPATAFAEDAPPRRFRWAATADVNGGRSWLFGVPIDELGARVGAGMNVRLGETSSLDVIGGFSVGFGRTEAGRSLRRWGTGVTALFHLGILRLGVGADIGSMGIETARSSPDSAVYGEARAIVGVEPFELGSFRPYVDLQLRTRGWAESEAMTGPALAIGVRY